jgi:undecaprenyl diphosphate synthase
MTSSATGRTPKGIDPDDPGVIESLARIRRVNPRAVPLERLPDVHPGRIPRHIAIIMDGNGRWARERGFPRIFGHRTGASSVRTAIEECGRLGVEVLTLYSFSLENWKRPADEVDALMKLAVMYLEGECDALVREGIRLRVIGRREGLPTPVVQAIDKVERATSRAAGPTLCLAINYGSRAEIVDAARALAAEAVAGKVRPGEIDEDTFSERLYTAGLPDPELVIRTAGEMRVSNYLLWQISYAELHVTDVYWPDFGIDDLHAAVRDFASRRRRFGGLDSDASEPTPR